jgi:hypothetical protein
MQKHISQVGAVNNPLTIVLSIKCNNKYKKGCTCEIYLNAKTKVKKWGYFLVLPKKDRYLNILQDVYL